jgi:hypothetical protein
MAYFPVTDIPEKISWLEYLSIKRFKVSYSIFFLELGAAEVLTSCMFQ